MRRCRERVNDHGHQIGRQVDDGGDVGEGAMVDQVHVGDHSLDMSR